MERAGIIRNAPAFRRRFNVPPLPKRLSRIFILLDG
jgi:hypothetical protein